MLSVMTAAMALTYVAAECPNACSSHGRCGDYDSCECYRNWMSSDCSERVCQFGLAHVDTPKGDLDSSTGALSGPGVNIISGNDIFPTGTTEQFPQMTDSAGTVLTNTAHNFQECSNKGICDREAGECQCFDGYEGSSCQRASCPASKSGVCSGHGTCRTISALAESDYDNHYRLWDSEITLGCECDAGYFGAACSQRYCKYGFDPLFYDEKNTKRYANWNFGITATSTGTPTADGTFSIIFYDAHGEDWETAPITWKAWDADADHATLGICTDVKKALYELPNDVIPDGTITCEDTDLTADAFTTGVHVNLVSFILGFPGNPGNLRQPKINIWNDGLRPSLWLSVATDALRTWVYPNGFAGEDDDFVPDYCNGVTVKINGGSSTGSNVFDATSQVGITSLTFEAAGMDTIFKTCLGESDARANTVANDIQQWDYGTVENPHLIKLVPVAPASHTSYQAKGLGTYAVIIFDTHYGVFIVYNDLSASQFTSNYFHVFTTTGTLQIISTYAQVTTYDVAGASAAEKAASHHTNELFTVVESATDVAHTSVTSPKVQYDFSCEVSKDANGDFFRSFGADATTTLQIQQECLERDDYVMVLEVLAAHTITVGYSNRVETTSSGGDNINYMLQGSTWPTDSTLQNVNPPFLNIYQVRKIGREDNYVDSVAENSLGKRNKIVLDKAMNWAYEATAVSGGAGNANLYKFTPPTNRIQNTYAQECSTRGVCNRESGLCSCFIGYTNDNCDSQDALAE